MSAIFDLRELEQTILERLPSRTRWGVHGMTFDHDLVYFVHNGGKLIPVADEIDMQWMREEWRQLLVFGMRLVNGGATTSMLAIDRKNGNVVDLDPERVDPLSLLNSSVTQFIDAFLYLDRFLRGGAQLPQECEDVMRTIDAAAYPTSYWGELINFLRTSNDTY